MHHSAPSLFLSHTHVALFSEFFQENPSTQFSIIAVYTNDRVKKMGEIFFFWIYWSRGMHQDYYEELPIRKKKIQYTKSCRRKKAVTFWLKEWREKNTIMLLVTWYQSHSLIWKESYYFIFPSYSGIVELLKETRFCRNNHQDFTIRWNPWGSWKKKKLEIEKASRTLQL